ncbi:hypothetical protein MBLNU457_5634t1 [Dothideomycetes sp. NU457]
MTSTITLATTRGGQAVSKKWSFGLITLMVLGVFSSSASGYFEHAPNNLGASGKYRMIVGSPSPGDLRNLPATSALRLYAAYHPGHSLEVPSFTTSRSLMEDKTDFDAFNGPVTPIGNNPVGLHNLACDIHGPKSHSASIDTTVTAIRLFAKDHFISPIDFTNNTISGVKGHYHFHDTTGLFRKKIFTFVYKHDLECTNGSLTSEYDTVYYTYVLSAMQCAHDGGISSFSVRDGCTTAVLNIDSVAM